MFIIAAWTITKIVLIEYPGTRTGNEITVCYVTHNSTAVLMAMVTEMYGVNGCQLKWKCSLQVSLQTYSTTNTNIQMIP